MGKQVRQVTQTRPTKQAQTSAGGLLAVAGRVAGTWLRSLRGRTIAVAAGAVAALGALALTGVLLSRHNDRPPIPDTRARHYAETDACLLTGKDGIAGTTAADA